MTPWDLRALRRALGAALLGLVVVWLVTAASDEGQLTVGARAGRTLPIAPLCSAVGVALALGTERVRQEVRALEALGRSPAQAGRAAALGAAIPSVLVALAIFALPSVDVAAFFPRAASAEAFVYEGAGVYASPSLGVRVEASGELEPLAEAHGPADDALPAGARASAALATGIAGVALSLVTARAVAPPGLAGVRRRRRARLVAAAEALTCVLLTLIAFQAAAARLAPASLAVAPPLALLALALARMRWEPRSSRGIGQKLLGREGS